MRNRLFLSIILFFFSGILQAKTEEDVIIKSYFVKQNGRLRVDSNIGSINVTTWGKDEVKIIIEFDGDFDIIESIDVDMEEYNGDVDIYLRKPTRGWLWGGGKIDVEFTIQVPRRYHLVLDTAGGNILISHVKGDIELETAGGDIDVRDSQGKMNLDTAGGDITVTNCSGTLSADTAGGDIKVTGNIGDSILETAGGNIEVETINGYLSASTVGGDIKAKFNEVKMGAELQTAGGDIVVYLPGDAAFELQASTTFGSSVHCDFNVDTKKNRKKHRLFGEVNGGGKLVELETMAGRIDIRKR